MKWAKDPNRGESDGLQYPFLSGELVPGNYAVWERMTGFVVADGFQTIRCARAYSCRINRIMDDFNPFVLDSVS